MKCPKCGLINPGSSARCDCGYDFATGHIEDSYAYSGPARPPESVPLLLHISLLVTLTFLVALFDEYYFTGPSVDHSKVNMAAYILGAMIAQIVVPMLIMAMPVGIYRLIKKQPMPVKTGNVWLFSGWFMWILLLILAYMGTPGV